MVLSNLVGKSIACSPSAALFGHQATTPGSGHDNNKFCLFSGLRAKCEFRSTGYLYRHSILTYAHSMNSSPPVPFPLESLLSSSLPIWKGRRLASGSGRATGFPALDEALPGGGWPLGAVIEILPACEGLGEISLLLPALRSLSLDGHPIALVNPPHIPYAPALVAAGLPLRSLLWVEVRQNEDGHWAAEQLLRQRAAVLLWSRTCQDRDLRRLQLAAEGGRIFTFVFRPQRALNHASPAAVRVALHPHGLGVQAELVKVRGGHAARCVLPLRWPCA
jgi:cell division inhibitor SulA